eukprot:5897665-Prymnesium_polylepis.2
MKPVSTIMPLMRRKPPVRYHDRVKAPPVSSRKTVDVATVAITCREGVWRVRVSRVWRGCGGCGG